MPPMSPDAASGPPAETSHAAPGVSFDHALRLALRDWNFRRRGSRSEYWWLVLASVPLSIVMGVLSRIRFIAAVSVLIYLFLWLVFFKAMVRRYHDIGRSMGWAILNFIVGFVASFFVLVGFVVVITSALGGVRSPRANFFYDAAIVAMVIGLLNGVWTLVWLCLPGKPGENRWG